MRHIGWHSATFELCKIISVVADDLRTVALLPSPRTAQHQVGGLFQLSPDCLYPFRFRYLGLRVTGDRSYILLHCFNRLEMVFPDLSAHAGPVTLRRVIPVDATEKQKAIKY